MNGMRKMRAAREALQRMRPAKMDAALAALKRRTGNPGKGQGSGQAPLPGCAVKPDRLQGYCRSNPTAALRGIPGFKSRPSHRIKPPKDGRFQAYGYVHWFESRRSGMKFLIESERREAWLPPYRLTLYADDATGLLPDEVFSVLEVLPDFRMTMLELAFDFAPEQMNGRFVRNHGLFGKSWPVAPVDSTDYWGTRRGSKRVQAYDKEIEGI
jgi:hypothetical protein